MRFTVLTTTFNRAHCISGVYGSLCAQTFRDFEWVVVDDGSTDGTRDLIDSWKPFFPIRYSWKPNGGMHTAINLGVEIADGELIAKLDSDDLCAPRALERFDYHWRQITDPQRYAFVVALCSYPDGTIVGSGLSSDYVDAFDLGTALSLTTGERWGTVRTDLIRRFPFPLFTGEHFLAEGLVWNRMLRKYGVRYINEPLRTYTVNPGSMSHSSDLRWSSPRGAVVFDLELGCSRGVHWATRFKSLLNLVRFSIVVILKWLTRVRSDDPMWSDPGHAASYYGKLALSSVPVQKRLRCAANAVRFGLIASFKALLRC